MLLALESERILFGYSSSINNDSNVRSCDEVNQSSLINNDSDKRSCDKVYCFWIFLNLLKSRCYNAVVPPVKANNNASGHDSGCYNVVVPPAKANNNTSLRRVRFRTTEDQYEMFRQLRLTSTILWQGLRIMVIFNWWCREYRSSVRLPARYVLQLIFLLSCRERWRLPRSVLVCGLSWVRFRFWVLKNYENYGNQTKLPGPKKTCASMARWSPVLNYFI